MKHTIIRVNGGCSNYWLRLKVLKFDFQMWELIKEIIRILFNLLNLAFEYRIQKEDMSFSTKELYIYKVNNEFYTLKLNA